MPFLYVCLRYYTSTVITREERVKELESKLIERLYETFAAMRLVKSFAREPYELQRYTAAGDKTMERRESPSPGSSRCFSVVVSTITILGTGLVLIVGGLHVMRGQMTPGDLLIVITYLGAVYGPLSAIAHTTGQLQGAVAGARRVRAMFALMPETIDAPDAIDATTVKGDIRFEDVGFTYPDGTRVLHDISFAARPGEMVALVGLTGAGKTTLVSLIPRFYDASAGRVLIDGVDVRNTASGRCARRSPSCCRSRCSSRGRLPTTCATAGSTRRPRRSSRPRAPRTRTSSSRTCRRGTTRKSPRPAAGCRAANVSG